MAKAERRVKAAGRSTRPETPVKVAPAAAAASGPGWRIGHGYDIHRLEPLGGGSGARPLVLGGVRLEHPLGPVGHSDGDALMHAVTDALLGAVGMPDIGQLFADTDPRWAGANSARFLKEAARMVRESGWEIGNIDATVVLERPRLAPHKPAVRRGLATAAGIPPERVNVKGKTHERVDAVGEGRAVEVHAVALLFKPGRKGAK